MMFLNALLHQSFTTTSSNKNAMTGSLETAVSSIHTSVMSVKFMVKKMQKWGQGDVTKQWDKYNKGEDRGEKQTLSFSIDSINWTKMYLYHLTLLTN